MSQEEIGQGHHRAMEIRLEGYKAIIEQAPSRKEDMINSVMFRVYDMDRELIVSGTVNLDGCTVVQFQKVRSHFCTAVELLGFGQILVDVRSAAMGWMT